MTLTPLDQNWYMDSGATSHMTNNPGNFSSYVNKSISRYIIVGNGAQIPIHGTGNQTLPIYFPHLHLNNVLHAPSLIKNLLSVHRLTTENNISIEFGPYGIDVKDFPTRTPLLRRPAHIEVYFHSHQSIYLYCYNSRFVTSSPRLSRV